MTQTSTNSIESLKSRYEDLKSRKITAEANLKHANDALNELREQARQEFGTDDLDELRKKLREMEAENERLRIEYDKHLTEIEESLADIESRYRNGAVEQDEIGQ